MSCTEFKLLRFYIQNIGPFDFTLTWQFLALKRIEKKNSHSQAGKRLFKVNNKTTDQCAMQVTLAQVSSLLTMNRYFPKRQ